MTVKSIALAALLSAVAATSFAQGPSNNTAAPTTPASGAMTAAPSTGAKAMHGDKAAHKAAVKHQEMKKSNNTAAPASAATK